MKNIILIILFLIITFVLNVIFYYNSSDYRTFLKGLKNDKIVSTNSGNKGDDLVNIKEKIENLKTNENTKETEKKDITIEKIIEKTEIKKEEPKTEIKLGKNYTDIVDLFSKYKLEPLELNTNLFDITNEYPDKYFEYYSRNLTLYLFPTKNYNEILDIFTVLETELPFKINETNNFGDKSFYINLNSDIDDSIIRIVVENKGIVFGLKIKKNEYNSIKKILDKLK